jgi:hypothetical protein
MRLDFDLQTLAFEHLGMSRNYDNTQIRRALQPAIEELEEIGFIEKAPAEKRYAKLGRGRWRVTFSKKVGGKEAPRQAVPQLLSAPEPAKADRRREARESAERRRVREYLAGQTKERRGEIEAEALASAAPFLRQNYESRKGEGGPLFEECRRLIIHQHVMKLLADA